MTQFRNIGGDAKPFKPATQAQVVRILRDWGVETIRRWVPYPPQRPPKNPRRPYRRTGDLLRSWRKTPRLTTTPNVLRATVESNSKVAPYNIWVQGADVLARNRGQRGQTKDMGKRGWAPVPDRGAALWMLKYRPRVTRALHGSR